MKYLRQALLILLTLVPFLSSCDIDIDELLSAEPPATKETETEIEYGQIPVTENETPVSESTGNQTLAVYFIDVCQGDCILIDYGETEVLIDAGDRSPGAVDDIQPYIDGVLEVMVATHVHADHIGGLIDILNNYEVAEIWHSGETAASVTYKDFMAATVAENATIRVGRVGDRITAGDLSFLVVSPVDDAGSTNNDSLVLLLTFGTVDFLFTGDAEEEAETAMRASSVVDLIDIDILKVGHHASRTASSQEFIDVIKPEIAVYMAKTGNSYGHPHAETIAVLETAGATIYGTDVNGTITVITDGKTYSLIP